MFFSARAVQDTSTIATAEACSLDPVDGHPFVGLVNFNPASFQKLPSSACPTPLVFVQLCLSVCALLYVRQPSPFVRS